MIRSPEQHETFEEIDPYVLYRIVKALELPKDVLAQKITNWTDMFTKMSPATPYLKADILRFISQIKSQSWPQSIIDPKAFENDESRAN